jgi:predicted esterase
VPSGPREGNDGRIAARPRDDVTTSAAGERAWPRTRARRDPPAAGKDDPRAAAAVRAVHGAGGRGAHILEWLGPIAEPAGVAVLAPDSRDSSWDAIRWRFGHDVVFVNRALERVFETVAVDPARIAAGGFSDGATYALSLGMINGDLFNRVVAFSPGFVVSGTPHGQPRIFISHGTSDEILPIDRCSRAIVPTLRKAGYDVTFRQFDGGHDAGRIAREGFRWVTARA